MLAYRSRRIPAPLVIRMGVAAILALPLAILAAMLAPARLRRKLGEFREAIYPVANRLGEIAATLHGFAPKSAGDIVVLVENRDASRYLNLLRRLRLLRDFRFRTVTDASDAVAPLKALMQSGAALVIPTELVARFHESWPDMTDAGATVVI